VGCISIGNVCIDCIFWVAQVQGGGTAADPFVIQTGTVDDPFLVSSSSSEEDSDWQPEAAQVAESQHRPESPPTAPPSRRSSAAAAPIPQSPAQPQQQPAQVRDAGG